MEKSNDLIGIPTRDLPVCSIVPQPPTLPRAPGFKVIFFLSSTALGGLWLPAQLAVDLK
jgi:hypothetical protein